MRILLYPNLLSLPCVSSYHYLIVLIYLSVFPPLNVISSMRGGFICLVHHISVASNSAWQLVATVLVNENVHINTYITNVCIQMKNIKKILKVFII